ncbi:polycystin-1-like protein 2 [Solea solea]|uniref:polycystin-1-like protein 2 n=1 Tax=Solea solea TaxID=90069 RepID=UPI00272CBE7A|nr:polycystin-1-like protein 2 [Solea solea]
MDMLLHTSVFLWISVGFLLAPQGSGANALSSQCDLVFRNVCYEFVEESRNWSQARSDCEKRGGELLRVMNSPVKLFLKNATKQRNTSNWTWWLGEGVKGEPSGEHKCTYMTLNPLRLNTTSDCKQRRSFLCTRNLPSSSSTVNTAVSGHASRVRPKRSMASSVSNINKLLREAKEELWRMETTIGEPTNPSRDDFVRYLLEGTKRLKLETTVPNNNTIWNIVNCTTGIYFLALRKCDIQTNPNAVSFFEQVFEIFVVIAEVLRTSESFVFWHRTGTVYQRSFKQDEIGDQILGSQAANEFVVLPSYSALRADVENYDTITTQMITFNENPHPYDEITGIVCTVIISNGDERIKVENLPEMIEIFLPRTDVAVLMNSTAVLEENTFSLTTINVTDPNMTIILSMQPNVQESLILKLSQGSPPTSTYFNHSTILTPEGAYRWLITPEMLQQTSGVWYIDARHVNSTWDSNMTLEINSFMSKCLFWHVGWETWTTDGCEVGEKTTPYLTHCRCNHLTLFGGSFFVMPNHVDVSRTAELFATVDENYVVLVLMCAFFALYLLTLVWACFADRRSRLKRKMTLLEDNHPGAHYNYLISVYTGNRKNSGTTANVTVMLTGSEGESETHSLEDPDKPVFERGGVDMFLMATPFPLGEVQSVRLQHDNSGGQPSWYVNKVTVQDLQTQHVFHYFCDCWLSSDHGDGTTKKTFHAARTDEIANFRYIFKNRTSTGFRDEHIWVSIVDPPSRTPFTRVQRVSCCMCLLLCTMAINIAFWNIPVDESSPVILVIGSLQLTWQNVMVGIQSGLLMFPINILIITIFRSIRPRSVAKKPKREEQKMDAVTVPTVLKDIGEVVSLASKSPRNKISETPRLESITDLCSTLDTVHEFIQLMQGECESDPHWVYCSKFLLAGLCHLLMDLEKLDGRNVPCPHDYQQALNVANVLVRKAEMVFSCHLASCPPTVTKQKKSTASCWLPWWCVFLGWFLLLSISAVSTYFTLLYGFQYGREKSIKWVMSLGLSLFQSIFILQPLKVIGIAVFFALLLRPVSAEESDEVNQVLMGQREKCKRFTGRETL